VLSTYGRVYSRQCILLKKLYVVAHIVAYTVSNQCKYDAPLFRIYEYLWYSKYIFATKSIPWGTYITEYLRYNNIM